MSKSASPIWANVCMCNCDCSARVHDAELCRDCWEGEHFYTGRDPLPPADEMPQPTTGSV